MASDTKSASPEGGEHPRTHIDDHKRTYDAFLGVTKWGIIAVVVLLIGMLIFLV
ncbi:MAG: aa3-type cytochrome c oxidase subunit IV [Pseudomonadota bacterium]